MFDFEQLAKEYDLDVPFLTQLYDRIVDKENYLRAVKMYHDGWLTIEDATTVEHLNVAEYRSKVAQSKLKMRALVNEEREKAKELQRRIADYLNTCQCVKLYDEKNKVARFAVFIDDGTIVCFMAFDKRGHGGIHMANIPDILENYNWQPNDALRDLRRVNKKYVKTIKKRAVKAPFEWFNFNSKNVLRN